MAKVIKLESCDKLDEPEAFVCEEIIKVEEPCVQEEVYDTKPRSGENDLGQEDHQPLPIESFRVHMELPICSLCCCAFERKNSTLKLLKESELSWCNKCILHLKLKKAFKRHPFSSRPKAKSHKRMKADSGIIEIEDDQPVQCSSNRTVTIMKQVFICQLCKALFERNHARTPLKCESDIYKCNKCILHGRLGLLASRMRSS